jgi:hypothetical protein
MKRLYIIVVMVLLFHLAEKAQAASLELSCNLNGLTCDNSGVYTLKGVDFVNVAGVQIVIQYDSSTLQSPNVTKGALLPATAVINSDSSSIKIAAGSTVPKSGTDVLATIKFTPIGATPGAVSIQSHNITLPNGNPIAHDFKNPSDFAADKAKQDAEEKASLKQLNVSSSNPSSGVSISISPKDNSGAGNGATPINRAYKSRSSVSVTAPATAGGNNLSWSGCDSSSGTTCNVTMNDTKTVIAAYNPPTTTDTTTTTTTPPPTPTQADLDAAARYAADLKRKADEAAALAAQAQSRVAGASVVGGASIGTITLPVDQLASTDRKTEYQPLVTDLRGDMTIPLSGASTAQTAGVQPTGKDKQQENRSVSYKSVLQFFREFKGEKVAKGLIALFAEGAVPNFTQEPPIALSDGITVVKLTLNLKPSGTEAPKFILQGASVKQLSSEGEEQVAWTIDALPKKGVYDAKLTVINGQNIMEFPLVVAPPVGPLVPKAKKFTEADFTLYLAKPAKFDLNKDEKFDSLDDYIFTANYIAALKIKPEKLKKEESKPMQKDGANKKEPTNIKDEKTKKVPSP